MTESRSSKESIVNALIKFRTFVFKRKPEVKAQFEEQAKESMQLGQSSVNKRDEELRLDFYMLVPESWSGPIASYSI